MLISACLTDRTNKLTIHELIFFELRERVRFHLEIENEQNRLKFQILNFIPWFREDCLVVDIQSHSTSQKSHPDMVLYDTDVDIYSILQIKECQWIKLRNSRVIAQEIIMSIDIPF